jgi:hypothetical protein
MHLDLILFVSLRLNVFDNFSKSRFFFISAWFQLKLCYFADKFIYVCYVHTIYRISNVTRINDHCRHNIVKQLNLRLLQ